MKAYGNFANVRDLGEAARKLFLLGVRLIHCPAWPNGSGQSKSTADETLMNDISRLVHTQRSVTLFIICSGDSHYVPTILEIKRQGKKAIVMATGHSLSISAKTAADKFVPLSPVAVPVPTEIFQTLVKVVRSLQKVQRKSAIPRASIKPQMIKVLGEFDEGKYCDAKNRPFQKFTEFLKEAQSTGWIRLIRQDREILVTTASDLSKAA